MSRVGAPIQIEGLSAREMAALSRKAKRLGLTAAGYVRDLVKDDLAVSEAARTTTFDELLGPGEAVNEQELDRLVQKVRADRASRKRKR